MNRRMKVCISIPLTYIKKRSERDWIRRMLEHLKSSLNIEILPWGDFDFDRWEAKATEDVYELSSERVRSADLMIVLFHSKGGSDGRGGEVTMRQMSGKPMVAFAQHCIKISPYTSSCLKKAGVRIITIGSFNEMESHIRIALQRLKEESREPVIA
jgi:hypothetical protein